MKQYSKVYVLGDILYVKDPRFGRVEVKILDEERGRFCTAVLDPKEQIALIQLLNKFLYSLYTARSCQLCELGDVRLSSVKCDECRSAVGRPNFKAIYVPPEEKELESIYEQCS